MSELNFDDIYIDVDDDYEAPTGKVASCLPLSHPSVEPVPPTISMPSPYNVREALAMVDSPDKLFDFTGSTLSPVQQVYIISYATRGTKTGACQLAGIGYSVVEKWLKDETFAEALQNAVEIVQDSLEEELIRRAMNGSDQLLLAALKAAKPDKYAKKTTNDVNINGQVVHTWSDLAKQAMADGVTQQAIETTYEEVNESE